MAWRMRMLRCPQRPQHCRASNLRETLLLPSTAFPMRADAARREPKLTARITTDLYRWQTRARADCGEFVLHDGPPYANGRLHCGHFLNKTLKDVVNRYQLLRGRRVVYIPGFDCHGLPIEMKALESSKRKLSPLEVRERARQYAEEAMDRQAADFQRWGVLADWGSNDGVYTTMKPTYEARQLGVLRQLLKNGLLHRGLKPVWWSPSTRTALAEAELEYQDGHVSRAAYVGFPLMDLGNVDTAWSGVGLNVDADVSQAGEKQRAALAAALSAEGLQRFSAVAWTTTPWTIPSNTALCVNPLQDYVAVRQDGMATDGWLVAEARLPELLRVLRDGKVDGKSVSLREFGRIRGCALAGTTWSHPLSISATRPMLCAGHVTVDSGTGVVHTAPAHGSEDDATWRSHGGKLEECPSPVDADGRFSNNVPFDQDERLAGLEVLGEGTEHVLRMLREQQLLLHDEQYVHRYPYDWRSKRPVLVRATRQWFVSLGSLHGDAAEALKAVDLVPKASRPRLLSMLQGRSEWCISRQRPWGVPIPVFYRRGVGEEDEEILFDDASMAHVEEKVAEHGSGCWWAMSTEELLPPSEKHRAAEWERGQDTLDASVLCADLVFRFNNLPCNVHRCGLTRGARGHPRCRSRKCFWAEPPIGILDSRSSNADVALIFRTSLPVDLYLEGSDQHRGWFQSSLLTFLGSSIGGDSAVGAPYRAIVTHGFVLDESGRKMSKSLGNVVEPGALIDGNGEFDGKAWSPESRKEKRGRKGDSGGTMPAYGADVLRFWATSTDYTRDVHLGPVSVKTASDSLRKFRNVARFLLGNLQDFDAPRDAVPVGHDGTALSPHLRPLDLYTLHSLRELLTDVEAAYDVYNTRGVHTRLQRFVAVDMSALYLECTKDRLYASIHDADSRRACQTVLWEALRTLTLLVAPIACYTAEHLYEHAAEVGAFPAHAADAAAGTQRFSVFQSAWPALPEAWQNNDLAVGWARLLDLRSAVHSLVDRAQTEQALKKSSEARLVLTRAGGGDAVVRELCGLLHGRHPNAQEEAPALEVGADLAELMQTSQVELPEESSLADGREGFRYAADVKLGDALVIRAEILPARGSRCPRCWRHCSSCAESEEQICARCEAAVASWKARNA